eukprot:jgi/Chlat1/459/Chrsp103S01065
MAARAAAQWVLLLAAACVVWHVGLLRANAFPAIGPAVLGGSRSHTNNWAVLVCTSRFWFNYRHVANTLSITVKRLGIPDSRIILMLADDIACNPRNSFPAQVRNNNDPARRLNVYGANVEVDYRGYEVTVENFLRVLTGRHAPEVVPRSKQLLTDSSSNILVYLTGHGGADFLKFQDAEEIHAQDIADAFAQMYKKRRYNEISSPGILAMASSKLGENSYSYHADPETGVSVIDRWTLATLEFFEHVAIDSRTTMHRLLTSYNPDVVMSTLQYRTDLFQRPVAKTMVTDFFGSMTAAQYTNEAYPSFQGARSSAKVCSSREVSSESSHAFNATQLSSPTTTASRRAIAPLQNAYDTPVLAGVLLLAVIVAAASLRSKPSNDVMRSVTVPATLH